MTEQEPHLRFFDPAAIVFDTETTIALIADMRIRKAIEQGEFDNLPGSGKPLDLPRDHDPDWWINNLMKREGLVMLPPSIQLRKDDAALDGKRPAPERGGGALRGREVQRAGDLGPLPTASRTASDHHAA